MSYEFEIEELEVRKGIYLDAVIGVDDCNIANDGIGAYEFWGAKGFDSGTDYVEEFTITDVWVWSERRKDSVKVSKRLTEKIKEMLYSDDKFGERVNKEVMDNLNQEPDCPEPDDY